MAKTIIQQAKDFWNTFVASQPGQVINKYGSDFGKTVGNIGLGLGAIAQGITQPIADQRTVALLQAQDLAKKASLSTGSEKQNLLQQSRSIYSRPNIGGLNQKLAELNLSGRQATGTQKTGFKPFLQYATPAVNVALTGAGGKAFAAMPLLQKATTLGASAAISGGFGALMGRNPFESAVAGVLQTPRIIGLTGITSPLVKYGASGIIDKFGTPLARNIVGRVLTGTGNVLEDEFLARLDKIKPGMSDRVLSFGIGALLAPTKEYEEYFKSGGKEVKEVIRDFRGRFAKDAGINPKNLDYMVEDPSIRKMVLKSVLDKKVPGLMSDIEKLNKYIEDKTQGFGSIVKSVRDEQVNLITPKGLTPEVNPLLAEARKYKSAEEFVRAQGTLVYHGTKAKISDITELKTGKSIDGEYGSGKNYIYVSENPNTSRHFAGEKGGKALEGVLAGNKFDVTDINNARTVFGDFQTSPLLDSREKRIISNYLSGNAGYIDSKQLNVSPGITNFLKQKGFSGIRLPYVMDVAGKSTETMVLDPSKILSKSQLTDIYNQAKGLTPEVTIPLQKSVPPEVTTTTKQVLPKISVPVQPKVDVSLPSSSQIPPSTPIIDPVQKIVEALKIAKPLEKQQGKIYSKIRSQQAGALAGIGEQLGGEAGYYKKLGQLKGEMPKVQFESIRKNVTQDDINQIFNKVENSNLTVFEKVSAQGALQKLLGAEGGSVPTKSELTLLNEVFPPEFIQAVLANRSGFQKAMSLAEGFLNLPRAVMATADLSAPLRQGIFLVGRPKQWIPAFKDMFKFAFSKKSYDGLSDQIKSRPNYKLMREAKLAITDTSPMVGTREEEFMSNLTEKIPVFGKLAAGSNRAYSGFLNKLRADTFDDLVNSAKKQGQEIDGKLLSDIGSFVNAATGRGSLPKVIERAAPALNAAFFSPRLMASRINLLNPAYYAQLDPFVRKEALKSLVGFAGTAGTVLGLAKLGGAEVGTDPRSADFGKIKVGNTRYDILGGFQQYIKLASQLASGQVVSTTTGKVVTLGEGYKPLTRKDIVARFFESKTSPVASFIIGLLTGQDSIGNQFDVPAEVLNRFIPMMAQDIYDLQKEYGAKGVLMAIPGIFGAGSQTYGSQELVKGKNQLGEETSELRAPQGLNEVIRNKIFGQPALGTTAQYSTDAYYKQLLKLPKDQARAQFDEIAKTNPDLAKKISESAKSYKLGVTPNDETLKAKGVASGDRAIAIAKNLNKLKTREEKHALWEEYVKKGIITKDVAKQLVNLLK